ncbi:MAG: histidine phosphatase family protein [Gemmatimonadetes bacterium]|nr:histidine phosphatase family protein [Gemmatimonadota bacterium]
MPRTPTSRRVTWAALALGLATAAPLGAQTQPVVVYVVRHAERAEDGTNDPPISAAGEQRARLLADMLTDVGITHVYTTDFRRTRATADPIARTTALEPAVYDADALGELADRLRATPGRHLVVGHSNTTPELVAALGGDPHGTIEQDEYDRLYIVTLSPTGVVTYLLRFGLPYAG